MYLLGNLTTLEANSDKSPMWPPVLDQLRASNRLGDSIQVGVHPTSRVCYSDWLACT